MALVLGNSPVAVLYAAVLALWFGLRERLGQTAFYVLFALAVTASVQLVGLYLVFATLIVPALATRAMAGRRLIAAYAVAGFGYAAGLVLSLFSDLPAGPLIVCVMVAIGASVFVMGRHRRASALDRRAT